MRKIAEKISYSIRVAYSPKFEGELSATQDEIVSLLNEILLKKYEIDNAYRSYSDRVRGPFRDALVQHWQDHAKEERDSAYDFAMKIVGLGGDPQVGPSNSYTLVQPSIEAFCAKLSEMELELIALNRMLIIMAGDHTSLKVLAENTILVDTQHLDDLRRMCLNYVG